MSMYNSNEVIMCGMRMAMIARDPSCTARARGMCGICPGMERGALEDAYKLGTAAQSGDKLTHSVGVDNTTMMLEVNAVPLVAMIAGKLEPQNGFDLSKLVWRG